MIIQTKHFVRKSLLRISIVTMVLLIEVLHEEEQEEWAKIVIDDITGYI